MTSSITYGVIRFSPSWILSDALTLILFIEMFLAFLGSNDFHQASETQFWRIKVCPIQAANCSTFCLKIGPIVPKCSPI